MAQQASIENDLITVDTVEISEFPYLAQRYQIRGVPKTVINEDYSIEGAAPETMFFNKILEAVKK